MDTFLGLVKNMSSSGFAVVEDLTTKEIFFSPNAWLEDSGVFQIVKKGNKYREAILIERKTASPFLRTNSPCAHQGFGAGKCGGCPWMMASYESQLVAKDKILRAMFLRRNKGNELTKVKTILAAPHELGYRNRAQLKTNGHQVGYSSRGIRLLAPISNCPILTKKNQELLREIIDQLPRKDWLPGPDHPWNYFDIEEGMTTEDIILNKRRAFKQGNSLQNKLMLNWVEEAIGTLPERLACVELFAGAGNFSKVLAAKFSRFLAAEVNPESILQFQVSLPSVPLLALNAYLPSTWNKIKKNLNSFEVLFLDPSRTGFLNIGSFLKEFPKIKYIFYVSCMPDTWFRDLHWIEKRGFNLKSLQPVDLFPNTPHIEILSLFEHKSNS